MIEKIKKGDNICHVSSGECFIVGDVMQVMTDGYNETYCTECGSAAITTSWESETCPHCECTHEVDVTICMSCGAEEKTATRFVKYDKPQIMEEIKITRNFKNRLST